MVLYWDSPYYNNLDQVYINWPNHYMSWEFKTYYLVSMGFWLQQIFVLNVENQEKIIIKCLVIISLLVY